MDMLKSKRERERERERERGGGKETNEIEKERRWKFVRWKEKNKKAETWFVMW